MGDDWLGWFLGRVLRKAPCSHSRDQPGGLSDGHFYRITQIGPHRYSLEKVCHPLIECSNARACFDYVLVGFSVGIGLPKVGLSCVVLFRQSVRQRCKTESLTIQTARFETTVTI